MNRTKIQKLQSALDKLTDEYAVQLFNRGNPDHGQNPEVALPDTACGWAHVSNIKEAQEICRIYIEFYDLGAGNWTGGEVFQNGLFIGAITYNGKFWPVE